MKFHSRFVYPKAVEWSDEYWELTKTNFVNCLQFSLYLKLRNIPPNEAFKYWVFYRLFDGSLSISLSSIEFEMIKARGKRLSAFSNNNFFYCHLADIYRRKHIIDINWSDEHISLAANSKTIKNQYCIAVLIGLVSSSTLDLFGMRARHGSFELKLGHFIHLFISWPNRDVNREISNFGEMCNSYHSMLSTPTKSFNINGYSPAQVIKIHKRLFTRSTPIIISFCIRSICVTFIDDLYSLFLVLNI